MSDKPKQKRDFPLLSGLARGLTADIVGGPVDLATILVNSGLAAYGYAGNKLGLLKPAEMPDLIENPIGGSDWFAGKNTPLTDDGSARFMAGRLTGNIVPSLPGAARSLAPSTRLDQLNIFAGPNSRTADQVAYRKALELAAAGKSRDEIFSQTGWFQGADKAWRYEIPDNKMEFRSDPAIASKFTKEELKMPLSDMRENRDKRITMPLFGAVRHPELQAAYPELSSIQLEARSYPDWLKSADEGSFRPGKIEVSGGTTEGLLSTTAHELQHAVQQIEKFARGGSPTNARAQIHKSVPEHPAAKALDLRKTADVFKKDPREDYWLFGEAGRSASPAVKELAANSTQQQLRDMLDRFHKIGDKTDFDLYKGLAGETEARNTADRLRMTADDRRAIPPWATQDVPTAEQYILNKGLAGSQKSLKGPKAFGNLPAAPGTAEVPEGFVRLYHQTSPEAAKAIKRTGLSIEHAKGIEGPRAIYASQTGFYGDPSKRPTVEFQIPKDKFESPFVLKDVSPDELTAVHLPWHDKARYILENPKTLEQTLAGQFDNLDGDYATAVRYIKQNYPKLNKGLAGK